MIFLLFVGKAYGHFSDYSPRCLSLSAHLLSLSHFFFLPDEWVDVKAFSFATILLKTTEWF